MHIWNDKEHSIGVKIIDEQHKYLFTLIDKVYNNIINNDDKSSKVLIMKLVYHANEHFKTEIEYLLKNNVPYEMVIEHINEHYILTDKLHEIIKKSFINNENIIIDVALFLNNWISDHIIEYDIKNFKEIHK